MLEGFSKVRRLLYIAVLFLLTLGAVPARAALVEPPTLVQYASNTFTATASGSINITYQSGDTVLVFVPLSNNYTITVADTGFSLFSVINPASYWQLWYVKSAVASTSVTVNVTAGTPNFAVAVSVYRGVSAIGLNTGYLTGTGSTISASQTISAGSKLVGMMGVAYNGAGTVTAIGDDSGRTTHGDLRNSIGDGNTYDLLNLVDYDGSLSSSTSPTLQLALSRSSNWEAIAIELKGVTPSYPLYSDFYVIGDIIDSDGLIHAAVANTSPGLTMTGSKGSFPVTTQNGASSANATYAMGHNSTRFSFTYGTIEASIKFAGYGVHSALWMLGVPSKPWANDGSATYPQEIDIAEVGATDVYTFVRTAYANNQDYSSPYGAMQDNTIAFDPTAGFHIYKLVWAPGSLTWYIDGSLVLTETTNVPSTPMYVLFGGYMGENAITDGLLPQVMTINYLNITDSSSNPVSNTGNVNIIPTYYSGWSTWNGITVDGSSGNVSKMDGVTIGTATGNYNSWDGLTSPAGGGDTIAFDGASYAGAVSSISYTWLHTVTSNADGILCIGVSVVDTNSAAYVSSATWNTSQNFSKIVSEPSGNGFSASSNRTEQWCLLAPATGTYSILVNMAAAPAQGGFMGGVSLTGVHQSLTVDATGVAISTSGLPNGTIVTVAANDWVLDSIVDNNDDAATATSPSTSRWTVHSGRTGGASTQGPKISPGTVTMAWTGVTSAWSQTMIALKPGP